MSTADPGRPPLYVRHPFLAGLLRQLPLLCALSVTGVGLLVAVLLDWRAGLAVLAVAMLGSALARLVLPARRVGFLAVRSRPFDVVLLGLAGLVVVVLAVSIPGA